ncbi:heparin lyase I family protein [Luteolibacter ambystomatis]|uniref:Heparin lyase I family protein n=1 Tax=Luteolibacter ambystomatis TaxID=2824561 RepID=A0A975J0Y5_9BACT|nr:heparin lyase I family protein [Luteolibacter ambystomatis]QUE52011.1 heparin lyase I family protein [Luteolibacter ambystomatis]
MIAKTKSMEIGVMDGGRTVPGLWASVSMPAGIPLSTIMRSLLVLGLSMSGVMAQTESFVGYESGHQTDNNPYVGVKEPRPESTTASQNYARSGSWSLRSELNYGETTTDVGIRSECNQHGMPSSTGSWTSIIQRGVRRFYGFSVLLDPQPGNYEFDNTSEVIMQQKHPGGDALFQLLTDDGMFKCWTENHDGIRRRTNIAPYQRGIWYDFVFEHLPSYMGSGEMRLYYKKATDTTYIKCMEWVGPTLSMDRDCYWKWGMYKANWSSPTASTKRVIYHDNLKVGKTFVEADPSLVLPPGWSGKDIGSPTLGGFGRESSGTYILSGSGSGLDSTSDGFFFASQTLSGDGEIKARLVNMGTNGNPLAGVMVRETSATGSKYYFCGRNTAGTMHSKWRGSTGGSVSTTVVGTDATPVWVRITRVGDTLTAYKSTNGTTWSTISTHTVAMAGEISIGLVSTSRNANVTAEATFDNVSVVP